MIVFLIIILSINSQSKENFNGNVKKIKQEDYFNNIVINAKTNEIKNLNSFNHQYIDSKEFFDNLSIESSYIPKCNEKFYNDSLYNEKTKNDKILKIYDVYGNDLNVSSFDKLSPGLYVIIYKVENNVLKTEKIKIE